MENGKRLLGSPARSVAFTRVIKWGLAATLIYALVVSLLAFFALRFTAANVGALIDDYTVAALEAERLRGDISQYSLHVRGYLLTLNPEFLGDVRQGAALIDKDLSRLSGSTKTPRGRSLLGEIQIQLNDFNRGVNEVIELASLGKSRRELGQFYEKNVLPIRDQLRDAVDRYASHKIMRLEEAARRSEEATRRIVQVFIVFTAAGLAVAVLFAWFIFKVLEQKRAADLELQEAYRRAQRAVEARDELIAVVSHDLRNPLSSVLLKAELMAKGLAGVSDPKMALFREQAEGIREPVIRMSRLIEDLLEVAKYESGRLRLELKFNSVRSLFEDARVLMQPLAAKNGVRLSWNGEMGRVSEIECDRDRVMQVFSNLIGNAIRFTPVGGRVTVSAVPVSDGAGDAGEIIRFEVTDEGPGIGPDVLPHVFDRFWQAKNVKKGGAGLGLSIAKGIVEAHGGRIGVHSTPGKGSTFFFTLCRRVPCSLLAPGTEEAAPQPRIAS